MNCPHCNKPIKKDVVMESELQPEIMRRKNCHALKLERLQKRWNRNVNVFIGKGKIDSFVREKLFNSERHDDDSVTLKYQTDVWLSTVLRDVGIFESTSEAKGAGWHKKAEIGFNTFVLQVRGRPHRITIYKRNVSQQITPKINSPSEILSKVRQTVSAETH